MRKILRPVLFLLPVAILLVHLNQFAFQPGATYSDLLISHYPNGIFIQHAIQEWKTVPLWSDAILSGYPFVADPLSGLFYLPGWIALAFPLPLGFNIAMVVHLIFGGIGMYCFMRGEGLTDSAALLGALIFESMPKLFSHIGAGHLTLIYAVAWTPWLLYAERRTVFSRWRWILPGAILGCIALADIRWAAYAGLAWIAFSIKIIFDYRAYQPATLILKTVKAWVAARLSNSTFAVSLAAPLLLPLLEFTRISTRGHLSIQDNFLYSLPPGQVLGLFYPNIGGMAEWILYPGAVSIGLLIIVLCNPVTRRKSAFWLAMMGVTIIVALGSFLPPLEWLGRIPGMDLLRVPPRILFLNGLAFAAVAGYGFEELLNAYGGENHPGVRGNLVLFSLTAFVVLLAAAMMVMSPRPVTRLQFGWGGLFLLLVTVLILLSINQKISTRVFAAGIMATCLIDLCGVNILSLEFQPADQVMTQKSELVDFLNKYNKLGMFRVYSPSYSLPQNIAALNKIEQADGVDPLQLESYVQYMQKASGVPMRGYSVTVPPYESGNPESDNQSYLPDAVLLGKLNVRFLIAEFPITDPSFTPLNVMGTSHVYENTKWLPRAYVQQDGPSSVDAIHSISEIKVNPNRIEVSAAGPGELVLSEIAYHGWKVSVDGKPAMMDTIDGIFRGVHLSRGTHQVQFVYRPVSLYIGLALAGLAYIIIVVFIAYRRPDHA